MINKFIELLKQKGFVYCMHEKKHLGVKIRNHFLVKGNSCIRILKISRITIISIYDNWNSDLKCGKCIHYNISKADVLNFIE